MYKFGNKNDMVIAWRNFKNIFSRPLFTIIFRPKIVFLETDSILRVKIMYELNQSSKTLLRQKIFSRPENPITGTTLFYREKA